MNVYPDIKHYILYVQIWQMLAKICPCISWLAPKKETGRKILNYNQKNQLEQEQEFMHKLQSQARQSTYNNQLMNEELSIEEQLEHELNLDEKTPKEQKPQPLQIKKREVETTESKSPLNLTQSLDQKQVQQELKPEQNIKQYGFNNLGELQLNVPEYGQNYLLLKQKAHNAAELLDVTQGTTQISLNSGKSVQKSKLKINKSKLRVWRKVSQNCFIIDFQLPCSYSFYNELNNKKIAPKENNKLIREYKLLESLHQNLTLKYLCLNKIGMLEPREFTYLKYTNNSSTNPSGHWQLCISKTPERESSPTNTKQGKLYSVSYIIQEKSSQGKTNLRVRTYIALDVGTTVDKVWQNILNELKNYVQDVWQQAANNYVDDQLV